MPQVQKPLCLIHFWGLFFLISTLWGNWTPLYKDQDDGKFLEQNKLNRLQMVQ